jgi:predicted nucleotidyltransferase
MHEFSFGHQLTLRLISWFPQIQMIALCNSRAMGEADTNSDIDLFIIAKKGNLWTARFIVTAITSLFGVRRWNAHGLKKWTPEYIRRTKDKFCLSFFITEEAMNFDSIRLQPDDPYLDKWIFTLVPLVDKNETYERFLVANWVQWRNEENEGMKKIVVENNTDFSANHFFFEWFIEKLWLPRTIKTYEKLWKPWGVVILDTMLKFHDSDQRKVYRDKIIDQN